MKRHTPLKRRTPMRRITPKLAARRREYTRLNAMFAALPEHRWCPVAASGVLGAPLKRRATDTHHMDSRYGKKLLDFSRCLRVSRAGHDWIAAHANEARSRGWLV
jgi:hypothetical protein